MFTIHNGINIAKPDIYGMHDGQGNYYYQAECPACHLRNAGYSAEHAVFNHFVHCSRKHYYVLKQDYPIIVQPDDKDLQQIIRLATLYALPLPEYDSHDNCIKQVCEGNVVCILHDMQGNWALKGRVHFR